MRRCVPANRPKYTEDTVFDPTRRTVSLESEGYLRIRSPRYPAVGLSDAINGAHLLWAKDANRDRRTAQGDQLAKSLGYKSHSGASRTLIGAMRQFGLLEKQGGGSRLSDNAMLIVRSGDGSREQASAICEAALTPQLFRDLYTTHRGEPEEAVKSYLALRRGFSELGAALATSAYLDTLSFANLTGSDSGGALTHTLTLSIPQDIKVDVVVQGGRIGKADLTRIRHHVDRWIDGLEQAAE